MAPPLGLGLGLGFSETSGSNQTPDQLFENERIYESDDPTDYRVWSLDNDDDVRIWST